MKIKSPNNKSNAIKTNTFKTAVLNLDNKHTNQFMSPKGLHVISNFTPSNKLNNILLKPIKVHDNTIKSPVGNMFY